MQRCREMKREEERFQYESDEKKEQKELKEFEKKDDEIKQSL